MENVMQIQYLKDSPQGKVGELATVTEIEARVLIALGHAIVHDDMSPALSPNTLLNLNGTPVIDDFGNVVEQTLTDLNQSSSSEPQQKKKRTKKDV